MFFLNFDPIINFFNQLLAQEELTLQALNYTIKFLPVHTSSEPSDPSESAAASCLGATANLEHWKRSALCKIFNNVPH